MLEMSSSEFESEMKQIGTKVSLGQDYCIVASEQFGLGASINDPLLIFEKCEDQLSATWISNSQSAISPFIDFMTIIKSYYKETKNGIRVYEILYHNKNYQFAFLRDKKGNSWYENLRVMRLIIKK
jgi:hypothetical protein